ncbi:MAG TPA: SCO family protein [Sphingomicrobium sp.]|nr:SCO family protein [Sphingomicrobium sp.]
MTETAPPKSKLREVRLLLWALVVLAIGGIAALLLVQRVTVHPPQAVVPAAQSSFGGPFTLVGADGKPFSSASLLGKPYLMYFGFTRCGDVCPTTLSRLVKLRDEVGGDNAFRIVFVTIDPAHDGPKDVGQYARLFNAPIIGLTGSQAQIDQVKKQYGIFAQAVPNAPMGQQMQHTATVLLFDSTGKFTGTITPNEPDSDALTSLKQLVG